MQNLPTTGFMVTASYPIRFRWDGRAMIPTVPSVAKDRFEVGKVYPMEVREDRSWASHGHFFASIKEAWDNLPETMAGRFPTPDHLRKFALIRAGYRDERTIVAASKAEALRVASFVRPFDTQAVVIVREATIVVWTAKSQSVRDMGKAEFQQSKSDTLDALSEMIGVERRALEENAGGSASW